VDQIRIREGQKTRDTTTDLEKFQITVNFFLKFGLFGMIGCATVFQALLAP
jgi:hypothetical protein